MVKKFAVYVFQKLVEDKLQISVRHYVHSKYFRESLCTFNLRFTFIHVIFQNAVTA